MESILGFQLCPNPNQTKASHSVRVSIPLASFIIVSSRITIESQPLAAPPTIVYVAVLFELAYTVPLIHVYSTHADCTSVPITGAKNGRSIVTIESHPFAAAPTYVYVVVLSELA